MASVPSKNKEAWDLVLASFSFKPIFDKLEAMDLSATYFGRFLKGLQRRASLVALIVVAGIWVQASFSISKWNADEMEHRVIYWDVISYYAYLPATFIYGDPSLSFLEDDPEVAAYFWPETTEDGEKVIKTTMGLSYLYSPFFFGAHGFAKITPYEANGYSLPYQFAIAMGALVYSFLGLWVLRRALRSYYSEMVSGLALLSVGVASNLYYYVVNESGMAHSYNFFLLSLYLYGTLSLFRGPKRWKFVALGALAGVIVLVRPTNLVPALLLPLLCSVHDKESVRDKLRFLRAWAPSIGLGVLAAFMALLPQFLYWKGVTGDWIYFSYGEERFFFDRPMLGEVLFGYRKGWLLYTPVMFLGVLGLFLFRQAPRRSFLLPIFLILAIKLYLISTWWAWWFGGSFGCRPIIDLYGFMAFPLAAFYDRIWQRGALIRGVSLLLLAFLIHMNLYQSWQYKVGMIHWDGMTKEAYWHVFLHKAELEEDMIDRPDYEAAKKGEPGY